MEQRLSELQAQIDQLSLALQQWRHSQDHLQPMEQRLTQLTERCAEILTRWTGTDERHTRAIGELEARLSEWSSLETRLQQDSHERMRELEQTIGQELKALRQIHDAPVKELRDQAAALGETCVAAANLALRGFERAEARFTALEADLHGRMAQLSHSLQEVVGELRAGAPSRGSLVGQGAAPFPLESVMRIQEELRESAAETTRRLASDEAGRSQAGSGATQPAPVPQLPAAAALTERMESLERAVTTGQEAAKDTADRAERMRRASRAAVVVLVLTIVAAAALWFRLQRHVELTLNDAAVRVAAAERQADEAAALANRQIAAAREEAERRIADVQQSAEQAQIISHVLAAPDLVRFTITGGETAPRAFGLLLWSRTRGMVFSASRLPASPRGAYQLWLLTADAPVSAGMLVPDSAGRVTLATDEPPGVPRPIIGASVTLEPTGGRATPSGATVLARPQ